jgi:hypothetical protein
MVLESHYTVDTDQRQQGEVHAAITIHAGSCGWRSRPPQQSEGTQLGKLDAAGPSVRNLAKRCCIDQALAAAR